MSRQRWQTMLNKCCLDGSVSTGIILGLFWSHGPPYSDCPIQACNTWTLQAPNQIIRYCLLFFGAIFLNPRINRIHCVEFQFTVLCVFSLILKMWDVDWSAPIALFSKRYATLISTFFYRLIISIYVQNCNYLFDMTQGRDHWPGVTGRTGRNQCALL